MHRIRLRSSISISSARRRTSPSSLRARRGRTFTRHAVCVALSISRIAWPHGAGPPRATQLIVEPGNPEHLLVASPSWGMFDSPDMGGSWRYLCAESFGGNSLQNTEYSVVMARGGRIVASSRQHSGLAVSDNGCEWRTVAVMGDAPIGSLAAVPDGTTLFALTVTLADGGLSSDLWQSLDRGDTWVAHGSPFASGFAGNIVVAQPSPHRVYAYGRSTETSAQVIRWSDDAGVRWIESSVPGSDVIDGLATHPSRPGVVLATSAGIDSTGSLVGAGKVWLSEDAGASWVRVFDTTKTTSAITFSPDGDVVLAGTADGLFGARLDALEAAGQGSFQQIRATPVWAVNWDASGLYVGEDEFFPGNEAGAMVSKSTDAGQSFLPVMRSCAPRLPSCESTSTSQLLCENAWGQPGGYEDDFVKQCESPVGPDAGPVLPIERSRTDGDATGCACSMAFPSRTPLFEKLAATSVLAAAMRRRRRRRCNER